MSIEQTAIMTCTTDKIIELLTEKSGLDNITPDSDIFSEVGLYGDDFHEFIAEFQIAFR